MKTIPEQLEDAVAAIEEGGCLECYAAHAAAKMLIENWQCALGDGEKLSNLVGDVDRVISALRTFKVRVQIIQG